MALENEKAHMGVVELEELEVIEIDESLLREVLEEREDSDSVGDVECVENGKKLMVDNEKEQKQKQKINCSEQHEGCNIVHEFECVKSMMEMEPTTLNDVIMDWYPDDDMLGVMVDFGYNNIGDFYPQLCEGFVSNEATYGCLWENL